MESFLSEIETYLQTSILLSLAAAYLGGVLVSLTPCVYPMIPITVGVIGSSNLGGSRTRGFILSLAYVTGLAITYAGLGLFAAATGRFFGTVNTSPYTFLLIGNMLLFFGLSMLGVFQLPFIGTQVKTGSKGIPGVFLIGMSSALVAGPCTAPALGSLLAYVGSTGNLMFGGLLLFVFAFGMGTVLLAAGTFSGVLAAIPRSGSWLEKTKMIIGLLMVGLAEYFFFMAGRFFT
jgi:thiol:disulfide interchange protein DsbD